MRAAEQIFLHEGGGSSSLIWLDYEVRPLIFLIHEYGSWRGFPDLWNGEMVRFPHPGTARGFAFLIGKTGLSLGEVFGEERPYQTEVRDDPWEFGDSYGRLLRLELPGMNVHVTYLTVD